VVVRVFVTGRGSIVLANNVNLCARDRAPDIIVTIFGFDGDAYVLAGAPIARPGTAVWVSPPPPLHPTVTRAFSPARLAIRDSISHGRATSSLTGLRSMVRLFLLSLGDFCGSFWPSSRLNQ
jgi:hypothetical protein